MRNLILIRHGETDYTLQGKYCGHGETPLNKKGIRQAKRLRQRLKRVKIDRIYSSDLTRALQTAEIIFKDRSILKRRGLREIDFGKFCGLTFEESSKLYPNVYKTWIKDPINAKIPQGESVKNFTKRVIRCFKSISNQNRAKNVVIVSHGGPIRIILLNLLRSDLNRFWEIGVDTAGVKTVEFKDGKIHIYSRRGKKRKEPILCKFG